MAGPAPFSPSARGERLLCRTRQRYYATARGLTLAPDAVDGAQHRQDRGRENALVPADAVARAFAVDGQLDVGHRRRVGALAHRVLVEVEHFTAQLQIRAQARDQRVDGAVARAFDAMALIALRDLHRHAPGAIPLLVEVDVGEPEALVAVQVFARKDVPDVLGRELGARIIGDLLHRLAELDLQL